MQKIATDELRALSGYIHELCGITLDDSKAYLVESRLGPLVDELGCRNYNDLYFRAKQDLSRVLPNRIIDAITTNETFFYRDNTPFELLKHKLIPDLIDRKGKQISIWSAACSTGQELYTIAMVLKELLPDIRSYHIKLVGTDISDSAIAQASYGRYNRVEIERGLPAAKRSQYFREDGNYWRVSDELRAMVSFQKINLMNPFTGMGRFDIIFCRNVAIYFTPENRGKLFDRLADQLNPQGALIIGSTESLIGISNRYQRREYLNAVFYQVMGSL